MSRPVQPPAAAAPGGRPAAAADTAATLLGGLAVPAFLARHWQKDALLVRNALPGFTGAFTAAQLMRLAQRDDVE
jgi:50S ribosomal protein L16 3-hydroxylase